MNITKPYRTAIRLATALLAVKIFISILTEYRFYFPADFTANFLIGREPTFHGLYRLAFYVHLISSPTALLLAAGIIFGTTRLRTWRLHRLMGKVQLGLVLGFVVPSGLIMAQESYAGLPAAWAFSAQAIVTAFSVLATGYFGFRRNMVAHQTWAMRTLILLMSPLLLRLVGGATVMLELDSVWIYRANAWLSWLIPLFVYQVIKKR